MSDTLLYECNDLAVELGGRQVLGPLDLEVTKGCFLGLLGPNGSGKTTLLRTMAGGLKPKTGHLRFEGRPLRSHRPHELARRVGVVPQQFSLDFNFTVAEMVAMGRYARGDSATSLDKMVGEALEATGMTEMANRLVTELSGGERQRALIAQTLAQQTPTLLLDEPLNNLDLNHQLEIMQLLENLHRDGRSIVVVLHDLNMAAQYCDELLLLKDGRSAAQGVPDQVLDPRVIMEVFRVRVAVHRHGDKPYMTPLWSSTRQDMVEQTARIHVVAGGGAGSPLLDQLVSCGFAPSVGIVSVFDTDYDTAQRYELEVVSAPPFQAFPADAVAEHEQLVNQADMIVIAPVWFGPGNLEQLAAVTAAARAGKKVVIMDDPPIGERDLSAGVATNIFADLESLGATVAKGTGEVMERLFTETGSQKNSR